MQTRIANNAGPDTEECIFLLSVDEVESLFANDKARRANPTEYADKNGVYIINDCCWWWLRSRGDYNDYAAYVGTVGNVGLDGCYVGSDDRAVRHALKLAR